MAEILYQELSKKLIGMSYTIHNILGPGLLEHAYEEAFCIELKHAGMAFERQKVFALFYKGEPIGGYIADLVVDNKIVLELKSVSELNKVMEAVAGELVPDLTFDVYTDFKLCSPPPWGPATLGHPCPAQIINYLRLYKCDGHGGPSVARRTWRCAPRATPVGYLMNSNGTRVVWKRFVYQRE